MVQGPKMNLFNRAPTPQNAVSLWRLPSAGRTTCAHSVITSAAPTDASRPLTAVRAAGYSSTKVNIHTSYIMIDSIKRECDIDLVRPICLFP
jgi:hypothetical protein